MLCTSVRDQLTVRASPLSDTVDCERQYQVAGQYIQVSTPFAQEDLVTSLTPRLELITEVTTYVPSCHTMVETVPPPLESGSIHFPARPGSACWPAAGWDEAVANGARVGVASGSAGSITGGRVAEDRVADGSGDGGAVGEGGMVAAGVEVRTLHAATISVPAMAPMKPSQNLLCICIFFLRFQKPHRISP